MEFKQRQIKKIKVTQMDKKQKRLLYWYLIITIIILIINVLTILSDTSWYILNIVSFLYFILSFYFIFFKIDSKEKFYIRLIPIYGFLYPLLLIILSFQFKKINILRVYSLTSLIDTIISIVIMIYAIFIIKKYKLYKLALLPF